MRERRKRERRRRTEDCDDYRGFCICSIRMKCVRMRVCVCVMTFRIFCLHGDLAGKEKDNEKRRRRKKRKPKRINLCVLCVYVDGGNCACLHVCIWACGLPFFLLVCLCAFVYLWSPSIPTSLSFPLHTYNQPHNQPTTHHHHHHTHTQIARQELTRSPPSDLS
jgi:hypothetical protein